MGYLSYAPDSPAANCYPVEVAAENSLARRDNSGLPLPGHSGGVSDVIIARLVIVAREVSDVIVAGLVIVARLVTS